MVHEWLLISTFQNHNENDAWSDVNTPGERRPHSAGSMKVVVDLEASEPRPLLDG